MKIKYYRTFKIVRIIIKNKNYFDINQVKNIAIFEDLNDIDTLIKDEKINLIEFLYFNRKKIEDILYEEEEIINVRSESLKEGLSNYFYLDILITDNPDIINYTYSIDLIEKANQYNNNHIKKNLSQIIISKVINDLIKNYKGTENYDEYKEFNILKNIEDENMRIIKNNINIFEELDLHWSFKEIEKKKLDEIYIEIIKALLIKTKNIDNFDYTEDLFNQMDLKNITITKIMFDRLSEFLNSKENYMKDYNIYQFDDFLDETKRNFYYFLLEYILKDSSYIYQINFLMEIRNRLIKNIRKKQNITIDKKNEKILEILLGSKYYLHKLENNTKNESISTEEDSGKRNAITIKASPNPIIPIENISDEDHNIYNNYIDFMNNVLNRCCFIFKRKNKEKFYFNILNEEEQEEQEEQSEIKENKKIEKKIDKDILMNNFNKLLEFLENFRKSINGVFTYKYNLMIKLIFKKEKNNRSIFNIRCEYIYYPPNESKTLSFQDEDILINGLNSMSQGFIYLVNEINQPEYKNIEYIEYSDIDALKIIKERESKEKEEKKKEIKNEKKKLSLFEIGKLTNVSEYKIIEYKQQIIFKQKKGSQLEGIEFIKPLSNNFFIIGGNSKTLYIINQEFIKIKEINLSYTINNVYEIKNESENNKNLKFVACSYEKNYLINYNIKDNYYTSDIKETNFSFLLELDNNCYIISNINGAFLDTQLFSDNLLDKKLDYSYKIGIKINKDIIVLCSNSIIPNGKDKLIIYNTKTYEIQYEFKGYSFNLCNNNFLLVKSKENYNNIDLLICCKQYTFFQRSGIMLINLNLQNELEVYDSFYNTYSFEPFCFCPILYVDNSNNDTIINETKYIFVGGFNSKKGQGEIKLYKIIYGKKNDYDTKIEFIQDLNLENDNNNFNGFNGAVTSIIQSKITGNILISCSDGNVYLYSHPNINYYLFYDEKENNPYKYENIIYNDKNLDTMSRTKIENEKNKKDNKDNLKGILETNKYQIFSHLFNNV